MNIETQIKLDKFVPRERKHKYVPRPSMLKEKNPAYRHGMAGTGIYKLWTGILSRCFNPKVAIYKYYGGRGIKVCESWLKFENFYSDMGDRPSKFELDRIDGDGNYEPSNCRWVSKIDNIKNRKPLADTMPGRRFGKWLVIERVIHKPDHWYYLCRCDCGYEGIRAGGELRRGKSSMCKQCKDISHRGWSERKKQQS